MEVTMRRVYLSSIPLVLMLVPIPVHAEYFVSGQPACISKQRLDEFLGLAQGKSTDIYQYISQRWCVYPKTSVIRVLSLTADDKAEVQFNVDGADARLWVTVQAIRRLKPRPLENVIIEDDDNPDIKDLCTMLSNLTHGNNEWSTMIAQSIVDAQQAGAGSLQATRYASGLATKGYELVIDLDGKRCIGELDVPKTNVIGCVLDPNKYYRCRRKQKGESRECFADLCTARVSPSELH
jgi:hypothetical protein